MSSRVCPKTTSATHVHRSFNCSTVASGKISTMAWANYTQTTCQCLGGSCKVCHHGFVPKQHLRLTYIAVSTFQRLQVGKCPLWLGQTTHRRHVNVSVAVVKYVITGLSQNNICDSLSTYIAGSTFQRLQAGKCPLWPGQTTHRRHVNVSVAVVKHVITGLSQNNICDSRTSQFQLFNGCKWENVHYGLGKLHTDDMSICKACHHGFVPKQHLRLTYIAVSTFQRLQVGKCPLWLGQTTHRRHVNVSVAVVKYVITGLSQNNICDSRTSQVQLFNGCKWENVHYGLGKLHTDDLSMLQTQR
ncbi:hypothetical protein J6590_078812 [Homalodisca vitripennis]|nr:hypothetical protein J6590_078812 [Homalodisca vitripennis]